MIEVTPFPSGPFVTNAYVLSDPSLKEAIIIDPAPDSAESIKYFIQNNDLSVEGIWLTHSHLDHIGDLAELKELYACLVAIHAADAPNIRSPGADGLPLLFPIPAVEPDILIEEGKELNLGIHVFRVIHTPGHSPGGVCFYCQAQNLLIAGDTLFQGSIGNISLPTSEPEKMWVSLDKLAKLPGKTQVYPGHGPSTTIQAESWLPRARELFG